MAEIRAGTDLGLDGRVGITIRSCWPCSVAHSVGKVVSAAIVRTVGGNRGRRRGHGVLDVKQKESL